MNVIFDEYKVRSKQQNFFEMEMFYSLLWLLINLMFEMLAE